MKSRTLLTLVTATIFLGACTTYTVHDAYYDYDAPVVRVAPPQPIYEYPGPPPVVGYVWIAGYWNWGGARYAWVPGRWEAPRPGHVWVPQRWERQDDHWRSHGGRWEPEHARPRSMPAPDREYRRNDRPSPPQRFESGRSVSEPWHGVPRAQPDHSGNLVGGGIRSEPRNEPPAVRPDRPGTEREATPRTDRPERRRGSPDGGFRQDRRDRDD